MGRGDLVADQGAVGVTRLRGLYQSHARAYEKRLEGGDSDAKCRGELGVGHPGELSHQQRRALLIGQAADIGDQAAERFALLGLCDRVVDRRADERDELRRRRTRSAQLVDAAVVGDSEQPRPQRQVRSVGAEAGVRPHEHVLESIFGVLPAGQHLPRVRHQALVIALVNRGEGFVVAGPEQCDQLLVGPEAQERDPDGDPMPTESRRRLESGRFHWNLQSL